MGVGAGEGRGGEERGRRREEERGRRGGGKEWEGRRHREPEFM